MSIKNIKELRNRTGAGFLDCKNALESSNNDIEKAILWLQENGIAKAAKKASRIAAEGLATIKENGNLAVICEVNSETDFVAKNDKFIKLVDDIASSVLKENPKSLESALKVKVDDKSLEETLINATATIGEKISFRRFEIVEKSDNQVFGPYLHQGGKIGVLTVLQGADLESARGISMHVCAMNPTYITEGEMDQKILDKKLLDFKKEALALGKPENIAENIAKGKLNKELANDVLTKQEYVKGEGQSVEKFLQSLNASIIKVVRYEVGEGIEKKEDNFVKDVASQIANATK